MTTKIIESMTEAERAAALSAASALAVFAQKYAGNGGTTDTHGMPDAAWSEFLLLAQAFKSTMEKA